MQLSLRGHRIKPPPFATDFYREFKADDLGGIAAELAYRFFLALFPFVIFLASLGGLIASVAGIENPSERVIDVFREQLPADAQSILRDQVEGVVNGGHAGFISISIAGALWAASSGVGSLIKAVNRVYDIHESRPFWKKALIALGVTVGGGLALIAVISAVVATQVYAADIARFFGLGPSYRLAVQIVRVPLILGVVFGTVVLIYKFAPDTKMKYRPVVPGAAAFTLAWAVFTAGFAFYVSTFSSYNATYGVLAGVIVLLLWFYVSSLLLLAGAEVNSVLEDEARARVKAVGEPLLPPAATPAT